MIWAIFEHAFLVTLGILFGIWVGKRSGCALEKARCMGLCISVFHEGRLSPSLRRVYHAIAYDKETVISADEYFGGEEEEAEE
jgi:hypothetical protein